MSLTLVLSWPAVSLPFLCLYISRLADPYFRCNPQALEVALCKRVMITPEEIIERSLDPLGAAVSRDGLAKTIYSRLFDWQDSGPFLQFSNAFILDGFLPFNEVVT